jgi:hypothetical protein
MLNYLSKPHDLFAKENYLAKLDTNVSPDFYAAVPALRSYLESQEVLARYAPLKWTGLFGFPPLHLETTPDVTASWRSCSRPVNPILHDHDPFKTKINRLCTYMYRTSTSPYSSPHAIAAKATDPFIRICVDSIVTSTNS